MVGWWVGGLVGWWGGGVVGWCPTCTHGRGLFSIGICFAWLGVLLLPFAPALPFFPFFPPPLPEGVSDTSEILAAFERSLIR